MSYTPEEEAIIDAYNKAGYSTVAFLPASAATASPAAASAASPVISPAVNSPSPFTTYAPMAEGAISPAMSLAAKKSASGIPTGTGASGVASSASPLGYDPTQTQIAGLNGSPFNQPYANGLLPTGVNSSTVYYNPTTGMAVPANTSGSYAVNLTRNSDGTVNEAVLGKVTPSTIPLAPGDPNTVKTPASIGNIMEFGGGAAIASYAGKTLYDGIQTLMDHGITLGHAATAAASLLGLAVGMHMMHLALLVGGWIQYGVLTVPLASPSASMGVGMAWWTGGIGGLLSTIGTPYLPNVLLWLTSPLGILAVGGLIVAAAILTDLLHGAPSSAETSLQGLTVWSTGKVLAMASTAAFISMGYNIDSPMALTSAGIQIPVTSLQHLFASGSSSALTNSDGSAYTGSIPDDGTPIVIKGSNGTEDRVVEITKSGIVNGQAVDTLKVFDLGDNLTFAAPTAANGAYIPWSVNGNLNAQALESSQHMTDLLAACQQGMLDPVSCQNAATWAASGGKTVTATTTK